MAEVAIDVQISAILFGLGVAYIGIMLIVIVVPWIRSEIWIRRMTKIWMAMSDGE